MSHVSAKKTRPGEPVITSKEIAAAAARRLGMQVLDQREYRWVGKHYGDWDVPQGMRVQDLGKNAVLVFRVAEPKLSALRRKYGVEPWDLALIADPNNAGCYTLIHEFIGSGGAALEDVIGQHKLTKHREADVDVYAPLFLQTYNMLLEQAVAASLGEEITFGHFNTANEWVPDVPARDGSWVSLTKTADARVRT